VFGEVPDEPEEFMDRWADALCFIEYQARATAAEVSQIFVEPEE
jgi:hypothetical protein